MMEQRLSAIDSIVDSGTCVISADYETTMSAIKEAVESGKSATFYVSPAMAEAINAWYWTPERKKAFKVEEVSPEEQTKIADAFGLKDAILFSNRSPCEKCGHVYGAFEFIQQGMREHGRAVVEAVLAMRNVALIRVNPSEVAICPNCTERITEGGTLVDDRIIGGTEVPHHYGGTRAYAGCCRGGSLVM